MAAHRCDTCAQRERTLLFSQTLEGAHSSRALQRGAIEWPSTRNIIDHSTVLNPTCLFSTHFRSTTTTRPQKQSQLHDGRAATGPNYPFETHLRVLRGLVKDTARKAVDGAEVFLGNTERSVSDLRGAFALALRLPPKKGQIKIDAVDTSKTRHGEITVTLPDDLGKNHTIIIS